MASECLPVDWCFMGSHVITDPTKRMNLKADYYCCMPCYAARVEHRCKFLRGDGKRKVDSDSESHPNPEPKKVSAAPLAPASSSSSSPLLSGVTVCPSNESLFKKLELLSGELEDLKAEVGNMRLREKKLIARQDDHRKGIEQIGTVAHQVGALTSRFDNFVTNVHCTNNTVIAQLKKHRLWVD